MCDDNDECVCGDNDIYVCDDNNVCVYVCMCGDNDECVRDDNVVLLMITIRMLSVIVIELKSLHQDSILLSLRSKNHLFSSKKIPLKKVVSDKKSVSHKKSVSIKSLFLSPQDWQVPWQLSPSSTPS